MQFLNEIECISVSGGNGKCVCEPWGNVPFISKTYTEMKDSEEDCRTWCCNTKKNHMWSFLGKKGECGDGPTKEGVVGGAKRSRVE